MKHMAATIISPIPIFTFCNFDNDFDASSFFSIESARTDLKS